MKKKKVITGELITEEPQQTTVSFNSIRYIISRFEINNKDKPTHYIVGFNIICDLNQCQQYVETLIPIEICNNKNEQEICLIAYNVLKDKINDISKDLQSRKNIIGCEFVPPNE